MRSDSPDVALHAKSGPRPRSTYRLIPGNVAPRASTPGAWMSISMRISGDQYPTCGPITAMGCPDFEYVFVTASQLLAPSGTIRPRRMNPSRRSCSGLWPWKFGAWAEEPHEHVTTWYCCTLFGDGTTTAFGWTLPRCMYGKVPPAVTGAVASFDSAMSRHNARPFAAPSFACAFLRK